MLTLGFVAAASSLVIIVSFDGSIRPPRDPMPGFRHNSDALVWRDGPTQTRQGDQTSTLASCSATVSIQHPHHDETVSFAIGGKLLPIVPGITSADAEYEGLILGLKWLSGAFSAAEHNDNELLMALNRKNSDVLSGTTTLIIRGDCKAIIDQLKSKSTPRRMETHYNIATRCIQDIRKFFDKSFRELSVVHELIPRDRNYLCDAICKLVTNQKQLDGVRQIEALIRCHHLGNALNELLRNRSLCHSSRLALGCSLVDACLYPMEMKDALYDDVSSIFLQLSGFFMDSSRQWSKICWNLEDDDVGKKSLKQISVACLKLSQHRMTKSDCISGDENDYDVQLLRKRVEIIFGKCTNSKQISSYALSNPYVKNTLAVVRECCSTEDGSQASLLLRWHKHISQSYNLASGRDMWMLESPSRVMTVKDIVSSKTDVYPYFLQMVKT